MKWIYFLIRPKQHKQYDTNIKNNGEKEADKTVTQDTNYSSRDWSLYNSMHVFKKQLKTARQPIVLYIPVFCMYWNIPVSNFMWYDFCVLNVELIWNLGVQYRHTWLTEMITGRYKKPLCDLWETLLCDHVISFDDGIYADIVYPDLS